MILRVKGYLDGLAVMFPLLTHDLLEVGGVGGGSHPRTGLPPGTLTPPGGGHLRLQNGGGRPVELQLLGDVLQRLLLETSRLGFTEFQIVLTSDLTQTPDRRDLRDLPS
jgi:hypothetical protein